MNREEILQNIASLLRQNRARIERVSEDSTMSELGLDSIRMTAFMMDLEEFFKILVPDQEFEKWHKVEDMVNYIYEYLLESENLQPIDLEIVTKKKPEMPLE